MVVMYLGKGKERGKNGRIEDSIEISSCIFTSWTVEEDKGVFCC